MLLSSGAGGREPVARLFVWQICDSTWLALSSLCFVDILGEYLLASSDLSAFAGCLASLCCPPLPLSACHCLCHVACLAGLLPCVLLIADPVVLVLVVLLVVAVALVDFLALFTFILLLLVLLLLPPVWAIFLS